MIDKQWNLLQENSSYKALGERTFILPKTNLEQDCKDQCEL